jgi:hypothetical protein
VQQPGQMRLPDQSEPALQPAPSTPVFPRARASSLARPRSVESTIPVALPERLHIETVRYAPLASKQGWFPIEDKQQHCAVIPSVPQSRDGAATPTYPTQLRRSAPDSLPSFVGPSRTLQPAASFTYRERLDAPEKAIPSRAVPVSGHWPELLPEDAFDVTLDTRRLLREREHLLKLEQEQKGHPWSV